MPNYKTTARQRFWHSSNQSIVHHFTVNLHIWFHKCILTSLAVMCVIVFEGYWRAFVNKLVSMSKSFHGMSYSEHTFLASNRNRVHCFEFNSAKKSSTHSTAVPKLNVKIYVIFVDCLVAVGALQKLRII